MGFCCRRVQKFRSDYNELRTEFEKLRSETTKQVRRDTAPFPNTTEQHLQQRSELLAQPHIAPDARRRYGISSPTVEADASASPFRTPPAPGAGMREAHLLREHTFAQTTSAQLDDFIAQGRGVLDSLVDQRQALKGTRRRLLDAANTLGLSRQVIGWVERRRSVLLSFRGRRGAKTAFFVASKTHTFSSAARLSRYYAFTLFSNIWAESSRTQTCMRVLDNVAYKFVPCKQSFGSFHFALVSRLICFRETRLCPCTPPVRRASR
jgi:hypothetical protein